MTGNSASYGGGICCSWESFATITGNTITGNSADWSGGGIYCRGSSPTITGNTITGNSAEDKDGGIYLCISSSATINYNNLVNEGQYEIYLDDIDNNIDGTNNWWGTTNTDSIDARIYDYHDDITLGIVLYEPILTSPAIGEPDSVYSVLLKSDETYTSDLATDLWVSARMYIQLEGKDGGCAHVDKTSVTITSSSTDTSSIEVIITETDTTSGIFRGTALIDSVSVEGISIGATVGETITITSTVDSTKFTTVGVVEVGINGGHILRTPQAFSLSQNFPNPFNPTTEIGYTLPRDAQVRLEIYNLLGQKVTTLVDEYQRAGYSSVHWDAGGLASGVYLYRLKAGDFTAVKKLVVIK